MPRAAHPLPSTPRLRNAALPVPKRPRQDQHKDLADRIRQTTGCLHACMPAYQGPGGCTPVPIVTRPGPRAAARAIGKTPVHGYLPLGRPRPDIGISTPVNGASPTPWNVTEDERGVARLATPGRRPGSGGAPMGAGRRGQRPRSTHSGAARSATTTVVAPGEHPGTAHSRPHGRTAGRLIGIGRPSGCVAAPRRACPLRRPDWRACRTASCAEPADKWASSECAVCSARARCGNAALVVTPLSGSPSAQDDRLTSRLPRRTCGRSPAALAGSCSGGDRCRVGRRAASRRAPGGSC